MKLNFKRITSVLTGAIMLSSTVALAAAANFPAPYSANNGADTAVVYGSTAAQSDFVAAGKVSKALADAALASATSTTPSTTPATITGETKPVQKGSQDLYLGDSMRDVREYFTKDQLPTVLADGKVTDKDGKEYTYTQKIRVPNSAVAYGETVDNLDTPVLYADFETTQAYEMQVNFGSAVNVTKLADKQITLFGKQYSFSGNTADLTNNSVVLYEKSQATRINDGESKTVGDHTISVSVEDQTTGTVTIDGDSESVTEGTSYKINGVDLYVKNVVGPTVAGTPRYMELYLNSNKLTLENGEAVQIGTDTVDGTSVSMTSASGKVSQIDITVTPSQLGTERQYIKLGDALVDPVFGTVKFSFASATPALNDSSRDDITVKATGEQKAQLSFMNNAGKQYDVNLFKPSGIGLSAAYAVNMTSPTYNATQLGYETHDFAVDNAETIGEDDYFITCDGEVSQIWEITNINVGSTDAKVTVRDLGETASKDPISFSGLTTNSYADLSLGNGGTARIRLTDVTANAEKVNVSDTCPVLYTRNGAKINLTNADAPRWGNSSQFVVTEETPYNGGEFKTAAGTTLGSTVTTRLVYSPGADGKDMKIKAVAFGAGANSSTVGEDDTYTLTQYGSLVKQIVNSDDTTVTMLYPEDAMSLGFYIGEVASAVDTGDGSSGDVGTFVPVKDTELASFQNKNLLVVGGSCINTVAAKLLTGNTAPVCGADFTAKANVKAGEYLIATYQSPYNTAKVATLVAGYDAADTEAAVNYLTTQTVSTDVGGTPLVKQTQLSVS